MNTTLARVVGSPTELYIQWRIPEEPNGIIVAYKVYCKEIIVNDAQQIVGSASGSSIANSSESDMSGKEDGPGDMVDYAILVVTNGTESEAFVENLTPFTNYGCFVTANTSVGEGNSSTILTATTDESSMSLTNSYKDCTVFSNFWQHPIARPTSSHQIAEVFNSVSLVGSHVDTLPIRSCINLDSN